MNQHDFVKGCLSFYEESGMTPEKGWEEAHYPAPKGKGTETIWLTHEHHQIQGILQSEEYGRKCFYGHAKKFLTRGFFVPGWFDLWDLYDKWASEGSKKAGYMGAIASHVAKNEEGKSINAVNAGRRGAAVLHSKKDDRGKCAGAAKGGRVGGSEMAKRNHAKKNKDGKSEHAVRMGEKGAEKVNSQKWMNTDTNFPPKVSNPGALTMWQKARGIDLNKRVKVE